MDQLSLQNPVFATYVISATLMILKAVSMSWLTVVRMMHPNQEKMHQGFAEPATHSLTPASYARAGFAALLDRIEGNGVRTVIVEDASRFARELMAQELGITLLISRGVRLLTASGMI